MYLKQIELVGFKSFADKTVITPQKGISCIVGPNGSGKSNISDAIRWVLGEQSAKNLRGGSISDVIFSGSKDRKALGMAEVTLTLDNSDGHFPLPHAEITVTRRNFRSGQSEYLINNQNCRLKDIHALFMDSGIGLDGISLISQGQISELISAKPEERRTLIEEAAGIVKYRNRKKEALRKLDDTERNMERLRDIINELSTRIEPLRKESEDAQKYLELKEKADYYEVNLSGMFLKDLNEKLQAANEQLKGMDEEVLALNTQRLVAEAKSTELQQTIAGIDSSLNLLQKEYYELSNKKEQLSGAKQVISTQMAHNEENKGKLLAEIAQSDNLKQDALQQIEALLQQKAADEQALLAFQKDLEEQSGGEQEQKQRLAFLEQELENKKAEAFEMASSLADIRNKLHYQKQLKNTAAAKLQRLQEQQEKIAAFAEQNDKDNKQIQKDIQALEKQRESIKTKKLQLAGKLLTCTRNLSSLAAQETAARFDYNSLESRYNTMKEMQENFEGFYPGVKAVLQAAKRGEKGLEGIIDAFAALIEVPKQYNTAIETCLGNALQDIVCRDDATAKAAIAYLKKSEGGRATFLPLNKLTPKEADISVLKDAKGVFGKASELIEYPAEIEKAVQFLLGRIIIADNLDNATQAAQKLGFRYTVITLDGDMVNPGGSMSGGSKNRKSNDFLSRRNNLEETAQKLQKLLKEKEKWEHKLAEARAEAESIKLQNEGFEQEIAQCSDKINELQKKELAIAQAVNISKRQLADAEKEMQQTLQENSDIETVSIELKEQLQQSEEQEADILNALAAVKEEFEKKQAEHNSSHEDLAQFRIELARRQEMLAALNKDIERQQTTISDFEWDKESREKQLAALAEEAKALAEQLQQNDDSIISLEKELQEKDNELALQRHGLSAENENLRASEAQIKQLSAQLEEKQKELYSLQIKKARMEADWENEEEKLFENFHMDFAALCELPPCDLSKTKLREQLTIHKREIAKLGNVNINAIEQFKEVEERYSFLNAQEEDLRKAKETLKQVIAEMDVIMKGRFKEAYNALSREFNKSFNRLFKGGSAALVLTVPDNLLETGVELEVHIPGKKVNNYNLLSGGEKSLIGLALMFAVLAVRPTPFCIMDEVDAALDEANVERFAAYLTDLSDKTQFVMISHRQGTMEAAGSLWGVTMQDSGVSKLISVKLSKGA